jgi:hypothetical protein
MQPLIQLKQKTPIFVVSLLPAFFAPSHRTQAVSPPPDGGYPGGNTAEGTSALLSLNTGTYNTAVGWLSLRSNSTGSFNTAVGAGTLFANTGNGNTATGTGALLSNSSGANNTADGVFALLNNTIGFANVAIGEDALFINSSGNDNTAIGLSSLSDNTTGNGNTAVGSGALHSTTGSSNIALGAESGINVTTASNVICIGAPGANVSGSFYVANVFETSIDPDNLPVYIDFTGRLGTPASSRRFKDNIKPMDKASEALLSLRPVTFHYKNDTKATPRFGLIAEEVAKVDAVLVVPDKKGNPYSVRYDQVNAMLLNEFLKEHHRVEGLEANAARQQKQIEALTASLQKVSAQLSAASPSVADLR